jgi:hypothetical protein
VSRSRLICAFFHRLGALDIQGFVYDLVLVGGDVNFSTESNDVAVVSTKAPSMAIRSARKCACSKIASSSSAERSSLSS